MTIEPMAWLPPEQSGEVQTALRVLARHWLNEWIVEPPLYEVSEFACEGRKFRWWGGQTFAIGASEQDRIALGRSVLGGEGDVSNGRDRDILETVSAAALLALAEAVRLAVGTEAAAVERADPRIIGESHHYHLACTENGWAVEFAITGNAAIGLRRHQAGRHAAPELATFRAALADAEVQLGCHLGVATLSAGQLDDLAVGDLIVLDGRVKDALPITLHGAITRRGRAEIIADGATTLLRITETPEIAYEIR
jgi:flagellar motor switch/type III secretory pathway protein FliN